MDGKIMVEMKDENIIPNEMIFLLPLSFPGDYYYCTSGFAKYSHPIIFLSLLSDVPILRYHVSSLSKSHPLS